MALPPSRVSTGPPAAALPHRLLRVPIEGFRYAFTFSEYPVAWARITDPAQRLSAGETARCVLSGPFGRDGRQLHRVRAAVGHAAAFWTWHSLSAEQGLPDHEAVQLMTAMVLTAAGRCP